MLVVVKSAMVVLLVAEVPLLVACSKLHMHSTTILYSSVLMWISWSWCWPKWHSNCQVMDDLWSSQWRQRSNVLNRERKDGWRYYYVWCSWEHGPRHEPNSIYFLIIWLANVAVWSMIYIPEILRYGPGDLVRQWRWCSISNHYSDWIKVKLNRQLW